MRHLLPYIVAVAVAVAACEPATSASSTETPGRTRGPAPRSSTTAQPTPSDGTASSTPTGEPSTPVAVPTCARIERPRLQSGSHLLGGQSPPVPYSSHPPTSGWHASGHVDVDVYDGHDPLDEPAQVSVLEADGVVVTHGRLPHAKVARLAGHVRDSYPGRVAVTPYRRLDDGKVAFTAWGVLQRCEGVDVAALDRFVRRFATLEPVEPGH